MQSGLREEVLSLASPNIMTKEVSGAESRLPTHPSLDESSSKTFALSLAAPEPSKAFARSTRDGPRQGLTQLDASALSSELDNYHLLHAARADFLRRLNLRGEAASSYTRALALVTNDSERRYLERRLREMFHPEPKSGANI